MGRTAFEPREESSVALSLFGSHGFFFAFLSSSFHRDTKCPRLLCFNDSFAIAVDIERFN
jgi:hypothetical protein